MKIKHLLFFIPVTFLVACEGTDLIEPDNVSKEQISNLNNFITRQNIQNKKVMSLSKAVSQATAKQIPNACVTSIMEYANNKVFWWNSK